MKMSLTSYDTTITMETEHDDLGIFEVRDKFLIPLLRAATFCDSVIAEVIDSRELLE